MRITAVGLTDVGLQREHNEDTFRCLPQYDLYLVADGMGGHQSGEVASAMASDGVNTFFEATEKEDATWPFPIDPNLSLSENRLAAAIKMANRQIFEKSVSNHSMQGMGTTVVALLFANQNRSVHVAHVGDSRAYRIRNGEITLLTRDHSLVNDYLMMMPDMPKEAMDVLPKNVITRALGMQDSVVVELSTGDVQSGDRFLLCTDGLNGQVSDERICQLIVDNADDHQASVERLVQESNDAGGDDNVTVVLVALDDDEAEAKGDTDDCQPQEASAQDEEPTADAVADTDPPSDSDAPSDTASEEDDEAEEDDGKEDGSEEGDGKEGVGEKEEDGG